MVAKNAHSEDDQATTHSYDGLTVAKDHVLAGTRTKLVEHLPSVPEAWIPRQQSKNWVWW